MGEPTRHRLRQSRFDSPAHEAMLSLLVAAGHVRELLDRAAAAHGVTPGQYNVLRILRGRHPDGYPRCEIARRLVERAPDLTRMIDRLAARGLVERARSDQDRRHSLARITREGLELLERMEPTLQALHRGFAERLSKRDTLELARLCEKLYRDG